MILGALEAGGTKMVCAIGDDQGNITERTSIETKTPKDTMPHIIEFFKDKNVEAIGIGSFGPIDLNKQSPTYGYITSTPKIPWQNYDLCGALKEGLGVPVGFDTDVNASALGEVSYGALKGLMSGMYVTIGTGIGMGIWSEGQPLHNMLHSEAGHLLIRKRADDDFKGACPYHGACLEGLASGEAMRQRYGVPGVELADKPEVWDLEADYIAQALANCIFVVSPQRIVLGGGVMKQEQLFPLIRTKVAEYLNDYLDTKEIKDMDTYIVPPMLKDDQGIIGCLELAKGELA